MTPAVVLDPDFRDVERLVESSRTFGLVRVAARTVGDALAHSTIVAAVDSEILAVAAAIALVMSWLTASPGFASSAMPCSIRV